MIMNIIGDIIYVFCALFTVAQGMRMREIIAQGGAIERTYGAFGLLLAISLVLIPVLSLSPFHLLWMFPLSMLLAHLSLLFPFNLILWPLASLYASLWFIGIKRN